MHSQLKLMCIIAHPDDESLAMGGTLAKYAREGVETSLVVATRGERGWRGPCEEPGLLRHASIPAPTGEMSGRRCAVTKPRSQIAEIYSNCQR